MRSQELRGGISPRAAGKKAGHLVGLGPRGGLDHTHHLLLRWVNTPRQTKANHDGIREGIKQAHGTVPRRVEGAARANWILMDYLDVVVHIFTPDTRAYYRLEELWGEAPVHAAGEEG